MNNSKTFDANGCVYVQGFVDLKTIEVVSQYFENKIKRGEWVNDTGEVDVVSKYSYYADPLIEVLLNESKEAVEEITGKELIPTYSYSRIYQPGESLYPHIDRPSCEISVTVNVASTGQVSPIYTQYGDRDPEKHVLSPGDAVVYKGCEAIHWRQPLKEGQLNVQFMLHYVDKNGPNAEFAKDSRPAYGMPSSSRSQ